MKLTNDEIELLIHRYAERIKSRAQVCSNGNFRKGDLREIEYFTKRVQELLHVIIHHRDTQSE